MEVAREAKLSGNFQPLIDKAKEVRAAQLRTSAGPGFDLGGTLEKLIDGLQAMQREKDALPTQYANVAQEAKIATDLVREPLNSTLGQWQQR